MVYYQHLTLTRLRLRSSLILRSWLISLKSVEFYSLIMQRVPQVQHHRLNNNNNERFCAAVCNSSSSDVYLVVHSVLVCMTKTILQNSSWEWTQISGWLDLPCVDQDHWPELVSPPDSWWGVCEVCVCECQYSQQCWSMRSEVCSVRMSLSRRRLSLLRSPGLDVTFSWPSRWRDRFFNFSTCQTRKHRVC